MLVDKPEVNLKLFEGDGNAFALMGAFQRQAKREGWTQDEVNVVTGEAMAGNYDHLVATLSEHCVNGGLGLSDDDE